MSPESGLTGFDYADCEFKKAVIKQCNETIVALTAEKSQPSPDMSLPKAAILM
jgi:DeoR/GlpR family transcriptional regulator of sugar metabolism